MGNSLLGRQAISHTGYVFCFVQGCQPPLENRRSHASFLLVSTLRLGYTQANFVTAIRISNQLFGIIVAARPRQWLKNLALFAPIVFTGELFAWGPFWRTSLAALAFCFISSANYLVNDLLDAAEDRKHPFKKYRPIARRSLPEKFAITIAVILAGAGLGIGIILGKAFLLVALAFLILHLCLYLVFRRISVVDVLAIATGYALRVAAGEAASGYHISIWLVLSVLSLSLLLAIGKRRAEMTLIQTHGDQFPRDERDFLYSEKLLDAYVAIFANATFLTYAYFSFLVVPSPGVGMLGSPVPEWMGRKWMMVTVPFVLYGIMRYIQLIYTLQEGTLEKIITKDMPLLVAVAGWMACVVVVLYGVGG